MRQTDRQTDTRPTPSALIVIHATCKYFNVTRSSVLSIRYVKVRLMCAPQCTAAHHDAEANVYCDTGLEICMQTLGWLIYSLNILLLQNWQYEGDTTAITIQASWSPFNIKIQDTQSGINWRHLCPARIWSTFNEMFKGKQRCKNVNVYRHFSPETSENLRILTRLSAREHFVQLLHRQSFKTYIRYSQFAHHTLTY